mgnify:FL=1
MTSKTLCKGKSTENSYSSTVNIHEHVPSSLTIVNKLNPALLRRFPRSRTATNGEILGAKP